MRDWLTANTLCQGRLSLALRMSCPNGDHVRVSPRRAQEYPAPNLTSASNLIVAVVLMVPTKRCRIHTGRVITGMPNEESIRHRPHENLRPHDGHRGLGFRPYLPITGLAVTASPTPSRRFQEDHRACAPERILQGRPMKAIPSTFRITIRLPPPVVLVAPSGNRQTAQHKPGSSSLAAPRLPIPDFLQPPHEGGDFIKEGFGG